MNPQDNTIPAEAPVKPTIEAPEAVILANINMDPNVSDAFKAAMGAAVRGAHAEAVKIEKAAPEGASPAPVEVATGFAEWWKVEEPGHLEDIARNPQYTIRDLMMLSKAAWVAARGQGPV